MKPLSAHGSKQIIKRVKKEPRPNGYEIEGEHLSFAQLLERVRVVNPKMTESLLRSRLKAGRRKWVSLTGAKK